MKYTLTILLLFIFCGAMSQDFKFNYEKDFDVILAKTNDSTNELYYESLVKRFQAKDERLTDYQVLCLLIGFTDNPHFKPYAYIQTERKIYKLNAEKNYKEALALSDSFLTVVPVSQKAIIEKSYALFKLEQKDSADLYMWQFKRIMRAMDKSGDGRSPESAIFSLGPADGQNYIIKFLRGEIGTMGSGRDKHGNFVDILQAIFTDPKSGSTKEVNLYFHIQHAADKMFSEEEKKKLKEIGASKKKKK